jgi:hypothetical protein
MSVNRTILAVEGLALGYPAVLGLLMSLGGIAPPILGSRQAEDIPDSIAGVLVLVGLTTGYRLLFAYIAHGPVRARVGKSAWWVIACCMVALSLTGLLWPHSAFQILRYGVFFVPTFIHLSISVWRSYFWTADSGHS